jgi:hypothetical protein
MRENNEKLTITFDKIDSVEKGIEVLGKFAYN